MVHELKRRLEPCLLAQYWANEEWRRKNKWMHMMTWISYTISLCRNVSNRRLSPLKMSNVWSENMCRAFDAKQTWIFISSSFVIDKKKSNFHMRHGINMFLKARAIREITFRSMEKKMLKKFSWLSDDDDSTFPHFSILFSFPCRAKKGDKEPATTAAPESGLVFR